MNDFKINPEKRSESIQNQTEKKSLSTKQKGVLALKNGAGYTVKLASSSAKSLIPIFKIYVHMPAWLATSPLPMSKRHYYSAKIDHDIADLHAIWASRKYGYKLISPTRNIANRKILKSKSDLEEAKTILQAMHQPRESVPPEVKTALKNAKISVRAEEDPQHCIQDGICAGLSLQVAKEFLEGKPIETIAEEIAKGSGKEAAANQAVYQALAEKITRKNILDLTKNPQTKKELAQGYKSVISSKKKPSRKFQLSSLWSELKEAAVKLFRKTSYDPYLGKDYSEIIDHISDNKIRFQMKTALCKEIDRMKLAPIAAYRNCKKQDVPEFGPVGSSDTNDQFLSHFNNLKNGVYSLSILLKDGGHATLYIQNKDGTGVFFDPNIGFLKCENRCDAQDVIKNVLKTYSSPRPRRPWLQKGKIDHQMTISKFELIS